MFETATVSFFVSTFSACDALASSSFINVVLASAFLLVTTGLSEINSLNIYPLY